MKPLVLLLGLIAVACGGDFSSALGVEDDSGAAGTGGAVMAETGGAPSAGTGGAGGSDVPDAEPPRTGGLPGTGGAPGTGGKADAGPGTPTGGAAATGGAASTGGATGATGGATTGGSPGTGGTGGAPPTGGTGGEDPCVHGACCLGVPCDCPGQSLGPCCRAAPSGACGCIYPNGGGFSCQ